MKYLPNIAGALLGLMFIFFSSIVLFKLNIMPAPPAPAPGSYEEKFMEAFFGSGYLTFVKVLELIGGILVAIPKTRNFGLLVLGPIIINILAYHTFLTPGTSLVNPIFGALVILPLFLLWSARRKFLGLLN